MGKTNMVLAIIVGVVVGVAAFFPLYGGTRLARKATATSNIGEAAGLLLGVFGSFIILAVAVVICIMAFRDLTLPFVLAMAAALIITAAAYGIKRQLH